MTHVIIDNDADTVRIVQTGQPAIAIKFDLRTMTAAKSLAYELINAVVAEYSELMGSGDHGVSLVVQNDGVTRLVEEW